MSIYAGGICRSGKCEYLTTTQDYLDRTVVTTWQERLDIYYIKRAKVTEYGDIFEFLWISRHNDPLFTAWMLILLILNGFKREAQPYARDVLSDMRAQANRGQSYSPPPMRKLSKREGRR